MALPPRRKPPSPSAPTPGPYARAGVKGTAPDSAPSYGTEAGPGEGPSMMVPMSAPGQDGGAFQSGTDGSTRRTERRATQDVDLMSLIGGNGLKQAAGRILEEFHPRLRDYAQEIQAYIEMRYNLPVAAYAMRLIETRLRRAPYTTKPVDDQPSSLQYADEFDGVLKDMDHSFEDFKAEAFSKCWAGFSVFEEVWKLRQGLEGEPPSMFHDNRLGIHRLGFRAQETIYRWELARDGTILGFWQRDPNGQGEECFLPIEKVLHFRTSSFKNNPQGWSFLRPCYVDYSYGKKQRVLQGIGFERNTTGQLVFTAPPEYLNARTRNADQATIVSSLYQAATNNRRDTQEGMVMPARETKDGPTGFDVFQVQSGGDRNGTIQTALEYCDRNVALALLCEMGQQQGGALGSGGALYNARMDTLNMSLETLADAFCDVINKGLIRRWMKYNKYPLEQAPSLTHGPIVPPSLEELIPLRQLTDGGIITNGTDVERFVRSRIPDFPALEGGGEAGEGAAPGGQRMTGRSPRGTPPGRPIPGAGFARTVKLIPGASGEG